MTGLVQGCDQETLLLEGCRCSLLMDRPYIMGILNVTPDSFSDGGRFLDLDQALQQGRQMAADGANLIDIGGESSRPGAPQVSEQEELDRVLPIVEALSHELDVPLSIDTTKSVVAQEAVAAGADFVNDISGLTFDDQMAQVVSASDAGVFVMHTRGRPDVMQRNTRYADVVTEVMAALRESLRLAEVAGIARNKIAIDPGIGFGKDVAGNLELLRQTGVFAQLGRPILLGTSRKSFIGQVLGQSEPAERLVGTLATLALGYAGGARIFRVHEVAAARQTVLMAQAVCDGAEWSSR